MFWLQIKFLMRTIEFSIYFQGPNRSTSKCAVCQWPKCEVFSEIGCTFKDLTRFRLKHTENYRTTKWHTLFLLTMIFLNTILSTW